MNATGERPTSGGIRLLVVDDNPHLSWGGRSHPVNATFHRFIAALLDAPGTPIGELVHAVPTRPALGPPHSVPVDARIRTVATAPFDGIAGFLRHARSVTRANREILGPEVDAADLVWLKVPASNAFLTSRLASRTGTPRFGWVAGSAWRVAAAQPRNVVVRGAGIVVGAMYDGIGRLAGGGRRIVVGRDLIGEGSAGVVSSLVESDEVRDAGTDHWEPRNPVRLAWAGRVAHGKGLDALLETLATLTTAELVMLGEGPARRDLEARARRLGVAGRIEWRGYVADRPSYLEAIAAADVFVHPSPAEGFPKVVLDAMAVGTPVVASPAGNLGPLAKARLIAPIRRAPAHPTSTAVMALLRDPATTQAMRERASTFAADHTRPAEAARLLRRLRDWFPELPWG